MQKEPIYRVLFFQNGKQYEIYARYLSEDSLMGFIEVEELIFSDHTSVVVDPTEEKLRTEFKQVKRSYIPFHAIIRIDEVQQEGTARIQDASDKQSNVSPFPRFAMPMPIKNETNE